MTLFHMFIAKLHKRSHIAHLPLMISHGLGSYDTAQDYNILISCLLAVCDISEIHVEQLFIPALLRTLPCITEYAVHRLLIA